MLKPVKLYKDRDEVSDVEKAENVMDALGRCEDAI